jgi:hypothetical protein
MTTPEKSNNDFDSPWKEALEVYFEAFMRFCFPRIHAEIDWKKKYEFLDKELEKIVRDSEIGRRYADKLVKVHLRNGRETWLLIHIEVQGYPDAAFEKRMFVYYYRIFDRYDVEVVSLAVLTDDAPSRRPFEYRRERWGCEILFRFPTVKILDFGSNWGKLEKDPNPFAVVVMAHLKARSEKQGPARKEWKLRLVRLLIERGYDKKDILELFRFIDWLITLPEDLEIAFRFDVLQLMEEKKMPYVTSIERLARKEGRKEGRKEMLLDLIEGRFHEMPEDILFKIDTIDDPQQMRDLFKQALICEGLDAFREILKEVKRDQ